MDDVVVENMSVFALTLYPASCGVCGQLWVVAANGGKGGSTIGIGGISSKHNRKVQGRPTERNVAADGIKL